MRITIGAIAVFLYIIMASVVRIYDEMIDDDLDTLPMLIFGAFLLLVAIANLIIDYDKKNK